MRASDPNGSPTCLVLGSGSGTAEAKYYKTLIASLDRIEREVVSLANRDLPQTDGKLIELQAAIAIRPKIKAIVDREYLGWSDTVVREGFTKQAKD